MATKKQHQQFNDTVESLLINVGGLKIDMLMGNDYKGFKYSIDTAGGKLFVSCLEADRSNVFSIFMQFENYEAAKVFEIKELTENCKWNIHYYEGCAAKDELCRRFDLLRITKPLEIF
jgi:hypothetical protein